MPLFLIQDEDRPMYVIANNFSQAILKWQNIIKIENELETITDEEGPKGVQFICSDEDIIQ